MGDGGEWCMIRWRDIVGDLLIKWTLFSSWIERLGTGEVRNGMGVHSNKKHNGLRIDFYWTIIIYALVIELEIEGKINLKTHGRQSGLQFIQLAHLFESESHHSIKLHDYYGIELSYV